MNRQGTDSMTFPGWFVKTVSGVLLLLSGIALGAVGWAFDVNDRLTRIESTVASTCELQQVIVSQLASRVQRNEARMDKGDDRVADHESRIIRLESQRGGRPGSVGSAE